jgi:hypothetical protein
MLVGCSRIADFRAAVFALSVVEVLSGVPYPRQISIFLTPDTGSLIVLIICSGVNRFFSSKGPHFTRLLLSGRTQIENEPVSGEKISAIKKLRSKLTNEKK